MPFHRSISLLSPVAKGTDAQLIDLHSLNFFFCSIRFEEALNALKSALIFTPPPLIFHVFTEDHLRKEFQTKVTHRFCFVSSTFRSKSCRSRTNGRRNFDRNSKWNFIRSNIREAMTRVGEVYSNRVAHSVCFFR